MATLNVDPQWPEITPLQSLTGWRREFCVELIGDGAARVFLRALAASSFKAKELQRGLLFTRLTTRFQDLAGCVESVRADLETLAQSGRRVTPNKENLFSVVVYDREAWERVQAGVERWQRR
jgi:hypothetical protein